MSPLARQALELARAKLHQRSKAPGQRRMWTQEEEERLRALFPDTPLPSLVQTFGRPVAAIYGKAYNLGVKRSEAYLAEHGGRFTGEAGLVTRFAPGHRPWNKGLSVSAGGRSPETRFKPGDMPFNNMPVGSERVTRDGIRQRKVRDDGPAYRRWKSVHAIVWEEVHGPIPPGHIVVFRDRNPRRDEIVIADLELVSRRENMLRNTIHRYPPELKDTIRQLGRLKKAIREASDEKQDD